MWYNNHQITNNKGLFMFFFFPLFSWILFPRLNFPPPPEGRVSKIILSCEQLTQDAVYLSSCKISFVYTKNFFLHKSRAKQSNCQGFKFPHKELKIKEAWEHVKNEGRHKKSINFFFISGTTTKKITFSVSSLRPLW